MLDEHQKAFYRDNGYLLVENVVSAKELTQLQAIASRLHRSLTRGH